MLLEALKSILAQTYNAFEILVIDDGSTSVAPRIMELDHGGRIRYVWNGRHRERSFSRNEGLQLARGKYIAYLDDDDLFYPDHLATLVEVLEQTGCKVAYTDAYRAYQELTDDGRYVTRNRDLPYSNEFDRDLILINNLLPICCLMHERSCLDSIGLFDETLATHEDWDLLIRLSRHHAPVHVKRVTAEFSWRADGSTSTSSQQSDFKRTRAVIFERYADEAKSNPKILLAQRRILDEDARSRPAGSFDCSIIIPVWNRAELSKQCLMALAAVTVGITYEVIIVDNGSTDETPWLLGALIGDVRVITNTTNLGFAKACNQGAAAARGKYLVFLNNDTIPLKGWLMPLVTEVEEHADVGIVGSKLLYADGTVQHAGIVLDRQHRLPYHIYRSFASEHPAVNQRREFQAVTGACCLIRRTNFEEVGGFDESFVNGFEDVDLCMKVGEKGLKIVYQPRSVLYHLEGQTPGRKAHDDQNAELYLGRWGGRWWSTDEDLHLHRDGYKVVWKGSCGGKGGGVILLADIRERAAWAHVAAAQMAAIKQDWPMVRRELGFVEEWPEDPSVLAWGGMISEKLDEPALQKAFLSRYLQQADAPDVRIAYVRMLLEGKDLIAAGQHLQKLLTDCPTHAEGLLLRGVLCMQREQYREAEHAFSLALRQGADRKKCLMGIGMAALGRAYAQGAWEQFLQVLAEHPDDAEAIHWLLRAGTAQNRWAELCGHLRHYMSRNPDDRAVRFALAGVLVRAERIDEARREHDTLRALAPEYDGLAELGRMIAAQETVLAMGNEEVSSHWGMKMS
jgi:GT2 family glycosyltransferase/Flp pilus assembly protein TadD